MKSRSNQEYRFLIHNGARKLSKNDPYARAVTHSVGNSIICEPEFGWEGAPVLRREQIMYRELIAIEIALGPYRGVIFSQDE